MKNKRPASALTVPTDLGERARDAITKALNVLIADAFALYIKTKNYHWHISGPHFRDYHLLFDEQADQIFATIDVLAERVRKLGGITVQTIKQIHELQKVKEDDSLPDAQQMLINLEEENRALVKRLRAAHDVCDEHEDCATESILEVFIDEAERRVWFLFESRSK